MTERLMKDSGVEWIGKIPDAWKLERLSWHLSEINEKNDPIKTTNILSLTNKEGVLPYEDRGNQGNKAKENYNEYKIAYPNTIVANSMNILIGSVGLCDYYGCVSPVYYVLKANKNSDLRYMNYIMQTTEFQKELRRYANGIMEIRLRVSSEDIFKRPVPIPSYDEQVRIADFLDKKVSEIDVIISKTKESIEEYKKLKQSIITEAVTKGLDPNVEMKNTGTEWLGEIPIQWQNKKLKFATKTRNEKWDEDCGLADYFALENIVSWSFRYIETESQYDLTGSQICKKNDVVFGKLRPYLAKTYLVDYDRCCSTEFAVFYDFEGIPEYLLYLITSAQFVNEVDMSTYGTKMPRANIDFINNMTIPVPPIDEQKRIVEFLDSKCSRYDFLISKKEQILSELEQYKKSLIYEYVTGKKEVKNG